MQIEKFPDQLSALEQVVQAYLYQQYADDEDLQAFFLSHNQTAQGYVDWFNRTPLGVYTSPYIYGPLLDWVGTGLYGIKRPVISMGPLRATGAYNTASYNTLAYAGRKKGTPADAQVADDDLYKRVLTWHLYLGDGRQMSLMWLKKRVARFLYGANGGDIPPDVLPNVSIGPAIIKSSAIVAVGPYNTQAYLARRRRPLLAARSIEIVIPAGLISTQFAALFERGYLAVPFQVKFTVVIQS